MAANDWFYESDRVLANTITGRIMLREWDYSFCATAIGKPDTYFGSIAVRETYPNLRADFMGSFRFLNL